MKNIKYCKDNTGKNRLLKKQSQSSHWKMSIDFEHTACVTPQQNHLVELGFALLGNKGRKLLHKANLSKTMQYKLFPKAFKDPSRVP
eukprot:5581191-Ditylum_brightwellii.AAC.1